MNDLPEKHTGTSSSNLEGWHQEAYTRPQQRLDKIYASLCYRMATVPRAVKRLRFVGQIAGICGILDEGDDDIPTEDLKEGLRKAAWESLELVS